MTLNLSFLGCSGWNSEGHECCSIGDECPHGGRKWYGMPGGRGPPAGSALACIRYLTEVLIESTRTGNLGSMAMVSQGHWVQGGLKVQV